MTTYAKNLGVAWPRRPP